MIIGVTGGAGFIGSNLIESLLGQGHKVRVLDDFSTGLRSNISEFDCDVLEGSLVDVGTVSRFIDGLHFVYHLGARGSVPRSIADPQQTFQANVLGTQNLLEVIRKESIPLVFSSSSSVYGDNEQLPKEETLMLSPISPYAASKAAAEHLIQAYAKSYNLNCQIFRFFNVYGPRQRPNHIYSAVIPKWIWSALGHKEVNIFGNGEQIRDFTFVGDVVKVLSHALSYEGISTSPINLALGKPINLNALAATLQTWFPAMKVTHLPPRKGDVERSYNSPLKLKAFIPDLAPTPLELGLESTIRWLKDEFQRTHKSKVI